MDRPNPATPTSFTAKSALFKRPNIVIPEYGLTLPPEVFSELSTSYDAAVTVARAKLFTTSRPEHAKTWENFIDTFPGFYTLHYGANRELMIATPHKQVEYVAKITNGSALPDPRDTEWRAPSVSEQEATTPAHEAEYLENIGAVEKLIRLVQLNGPFPNPIAANVLETLGNIIVRGHKKPEDFTEINAALSRRRPSVEEPLTVPDNVYDYLVSRHRFSFADARTMTKGHGKEGLSGQFQTFLRSHPVTMWMELNLEEHSIICYMPHGPFKGEKGRVRITNRPQGSETISPQPDIRDAMYDAVAKQAAMNIEKEILGDLAGVATLRATDEGLKTVSKLNTEPHFAEKFPMQAWLDWIAKLGWGYVDNPLPPVEGGWRPLNALEVNRLPDRVRAYIHNLETKPCPSSGELNVARECIAELRETLARVQQDLNMVNEAKNSLIGQNRVLEKSLEERNMSYNNLRGILDRKQSEAVADVKEERYQAALTGLCANPNVIDMRTFNGVTPIDAPEYPLNKDVVAMAADFASL